VAARGQTAGEYAVNRWRLDNGLSWVRWDVRLERAAAYKAQSLTVEPFDHTLPGYGSVFGLLAAWRVPYRTAGENLCWWNGPDPITNCVRMWSESPGHRRLMSGAWRRLGVAVAVTPEKTYVVLEVLR
jgi:uncharacterized protein YkwD